MLVVLVGVPIVRTVSLLLTQLLMFMNHDTAGRGGGRLVTLHHFLPPLPLTDKTPQLYPTSSAQRTKEFGGRVADPAQPPVPGEHTTPEGSVCRWVSGEG